MFLLAHFDTYNTIQEDMLSPIHGRDVKESQLLWSVNWDPCSEIGQGCFLTWCISWKHTSTLVWRLTLDTVVCTTSMSSTDFVVHFLLLRSWAISHKRCNGLPETCRVNNSVEVLVGLERWVETSGCINTFYVGD